MKSQNYLPAGNIDMAMLLKAVQMPFMPVCSSLMQDKEQNFQT